MSLCIREHRRQKGPQGQQVLEGLGIQGVGACLGQGAAGCRVGLLSRSTSLGFVKAEQKQLKDALGPRAPTICLPGLWLIQVLLNSFRIFGNAEQSGRTSC